MQVVISNYAIPIIENRTIWDTLNSSPIEYLTTQDIAIISLTCIQRINNKSNKIIFPSLKKAFNR